MGGCRLFLFIFVFGVPRVIIFVLRYNVIRGVCVCVCVCVCVIVFLFLCLMSVCRHSFIISQFIFLSSQLFF